MQEIKNKHDKHIEELFDDNKNLYRYIKDLENIVKKYENRKNEYEGVIDNFDKTITSEEENNKLLKEEYYAKHKLVRNYPAKIQVNLAKLNGGKKTKTENELCKKLSDDENKIVIVNEPTLK